ncbi:MAG: CvpA family protein, partial [Gelidibacter sp.]
LSVVLNIFDSMNRAVPLTDEKSIEDSALYSPVKALVPMIFPLILEKKKELENGSEAAPTGTEQPAQ